jgi:hypothetical protein
MENLLKETLRDLGVNSINEAAQIIEWASIYMEFKEVKDRVLPPDHTNAEVVAFLSAMAEEYDAFEQEVRGTIMLKDGTWIVRVPDWDYNYDHFWKWSSRRSVAHSATVPLFEHLNS